MPVVANGVALTDEQQEALLKAGTSAASMGLLGYNPKDPARPTINLPKTKTEALTQAATLPLFLYGGPEAEEGASFGTRMLYRALRAGVTGTENLASYGVQGLTNKLEGKPSGMSLGGAAQAFGLGAAASPALELATSLAGHASGLTAADKASKEALTARNKALGEVGTAQQGVNKAQSDIAQATAKAAQDRKNQLASETNKEIGKSAVQLTTEAQAGKRLRSILGGTAPQAESDVVNQETRNSQNAVWHAINSIHQDINAGYKKLFARYAKNTTNPSTLADPLVALRTQMQLQGRDAQLGAPTRKLLNDAIELGSPDPLLAHFSAEDLAMMSPRDRDAARGLFAKAKTETTKEGDRPNYLGKSSAPKPKKEVPGPTVDQHLILQSRAQQILRNTSASATDKGVASQIFRASHASLDELGDQKFLTDAEKQQHQVLKGRTRSFYTDFGNLFGSGKTQTPGELGEKLIKQPTHVIERVIGAATPTERSAIQRSFADYVLPEGAEMKDIIPKLGDADRKGLLRKLYPGRYGQLKDWTSTITAQDRLERMGQDPRTQQEAIDGLRDAANTPEGRAFLDRMMKMDPAKQAATTVGKPKVISRAPLTEALKNQGRAIKEYEKLPTGHEAAIASLKPGQNSIVPPFMARWMGLYQPIEALIGMGMMKTHPGVAAGAFTLFATHTAMRRAFASESFREQYYKAITNPNLRQSVKALARLSMGQALQESNRGDENAAP